VPGLISLSLPIARFKGGGKEEGAQNAFFECMAWTWRLGSIRAQIPVGESRYHIKEELL
jgi:hypothetical protein